VRRDGDPAAFSIEAIAGEDGCSNGSGDAGGGGSGLMLGCWRSGYLAASGPRLLSAIVA